MKMIKFNEIPNQAWFDKITYTIQTINLLLEEAEKNTSQTKAFHHSAAYLSGYPVEFLINMAICLSGEEEHDMLHASEEPLNYAIKMILKKSPAQELIDLNMIRNMRIAKLDIHKFRYHPNSNFRAFGYTTSDELRKDLSQVMSQANELKKKFPSKFANKVMP